MIKADPKSIDWGDEGVVITKEEYLDDMIVTARNNGTLDMLVAYLENGNVRNAIANAYQTAEN